MIRNLFRGLVILLATAAMTGPSGAQQQAPQQQPAAQTAPAAAPNAASPEQPKATQMPAQAPRAAPAADAAAQPAPAEAATQPAAPPPPPAEPKAEEPPPELRDLLAPIDRASDEMDDVLKKLKEIKRDDDALAKLRNRVEDIRARAQAAADPLAPRLEAIKALTAKLGPVPDKDSPPDTPQIAAERKRLKAFESGIDGALKASDLVQARAHQIQTLIQQRRREIFTGDLLRRSRSPLTPVIWKQVAAELPGALSQIKDVGRFWMSAASTRPFKLGSLLAGVLFAYILLRAGLRRIVQARLNDSAGADRPSFFERAATAGGVAPILAVPPLAAVLGLYFGLDNLGLLYGQVENVAASTVFASLVYIGVSALSTAVLQPRHSNWRLLDIADRPAGRLTAIVKLIALVYGADAVLKDLIQNLTLPLPVSVAQAFIASLAFAALLVQIVRTRFDPLTPSDMAVPVSRMRPYAIKIPLLLVALAIIVTSLLGYVALGRFIAGQVVVTGSVIVLALLLHLAIRALTTEEHPEWLPQPAWLRQQSFGLETSQRRTIIRVVAFLLNVLLALLAIPFILITWGFSLPETLGWLRAAIFGFEIGQFRISLARIFLAVVLFAALYFVTRIVQRWLQSSVLQPSRLDQGIANSIYTGVGYAGIAVAALAAISFGGIDITNLAIVAGALSVGIGFGLQSIVNNFVSGLILLVERPIKVGDWIVVKDHEGYVRRISVRSTELETFDRASVILPNSDLIANPVKNWTHRNLLGRAIIKVSVATTANADKVMEILKEVASKTENILPHPAPFVSFDNISPNSFDFSVGIYVADINRAGGAKTELRAAILRAFTEAGIELPNTKQHVYLRDLDFLKAVMMRVIEQRAGSGPTADRPDEEDENTDGAGAMRKN